MGEGKLRSTGPLPWLEPTFLTQWVSIWQCAMPHRLRARALANVAGYRFGSGPELGQNFTRIQLWLALLQRELCIQLPAAAA